jgi:hypothetical protein
VPLLLISVEAMHRILVESTIARTEGRHANIQGADSGAEAAIVLRTPVF